MVFCTNCGQELSEDANFCANCGTKIIEQPRKVEEADVESEYEEPQVVHTPTKTKTSTTSKPTLGDKTKAKFREFWSKLSFFGKASTIGIAASVFLGIIAFLAGRVFAGMIAIVWLAVVIVALLMKKDVIKVPKTWIPILAVILSFVLIVPYFNLFKVNIADYEKYAWNEIKLADMLPTPESPYGEIISNSDSYLALYVNKATEEQYNQYIEACKNKGFTIDTETSGSFFYAYNEQGYKLSLSYYEYSNEMHINLSKSRDLGTLKWSNSELAQMLPVPESTVGDIQQDDANGFNAYVGNTSIDAFNSYVQACEAKGFTVDANKTDKRFSAENADGYKLSVEYQGNNVIYISLDEPEYKVTIEVECVENWIFSKYDVKVYVDDSLEGTITHGDSKTFELTLTKGTYVLKFVNKDNDDVDGKVEFYIQKDESLKYKISCHGSKIDVETIAGTSKPNTNDNQQGSTDYALDYSDAASFEKALNDGVKVNGKIVQFEVLEYKPDSALGINCWAGEHLNFISENELDVGAGNIIIGRVTKEPTKTLGSWKIYYEVLSIGGVKIEKPDDSQSGETTEPTPSEPTPSEPTPTNTAGAPDDWTNLLEKHYEEVKKKFEDAGFTNITCVAHEIDYNENNVFEGSVVNIAIGENGEICTFAKGEQWAKDIKIRIDYRVKPAKVEGPDTTKIVLPEKTSKLGKDFDSDGKSTVYYINVDGTSNKPSIKTWGSATVTDGVAEYLDYLKGLGFTVTVVDTSHREPYSGFHVYETNFKVSNSNVSWTMYLYIQKEKYVEYELDIHKN